MNKQTAVEWLMEQINNKPLVSGWSDSQLTISISKDIINQAKAMEKEQIEDAYFSGSADNMNDEGDFKKYYNQTFGGEECSKHGIRREDESCTLNDSCIYPKCLE